MHETFRGWDEAAVYLKSFAAAQKALELGAGASARLNQGQQSALLALAQRLPHNGVVIADEVGMGKTRIAVETARAVIAAGGRVAVLVPPGLGYQWRDELRQGHVESPHIIRSLANYFGPWKAQAESSPVAGEAWKDEAKPWFSQPLLIVSHAFTNWRLGDSPANWRWSLLPELYAHWRKRTTGRMPRKYFSEEALLNSFVSSTARSICAAIPNDPDNIAWQKCHALSEKTPWPAAVDAKQYSRNKDLRPWLECAVGLGLGVFDLVIVDEAHKSRGAESGLSGLLESVIQRSPSARVLAMTATPVELEVGQWQNTLARIGLDIKSTPAFTEAIDAYAKAVKTARLSPGNTEVREAYAKAAGDFQSVLSPYLLRRDKRTDQAVLAFVRHSGASANSYRHEEEISVDTARLAPAWRKSVCAAEALSFTSRNSQDRQSQRIRLTLGNGHGISTLLDRKLSPDPSDVQQEESDVEQEAEALKSLGDTNGQSASAEVPTDNGKQAQRTQWWQSALRQSFAESEDSLFGHPALMACVDAIETATLAGEKVLIFGRFTQPLRALVSLLNAREMLRCLRDGRPWAQGKIHEPGSADRAHDDERPAVRAALRQLGSSLSLSRVNEILGQQYKDLENARERWRAGLVDRLEAGLGMTGLSAEAESLSKVQRLFCAFKESAKRGAPGANNQDGTHALALVGKAMLELMGDGENAAPADFALAFEQLVNALADRNEGDQDGEALELWPMLEARLREEYNRPQGGFARLMFGGTSPSARRVLQLAFNRPQSFPKVLVAQSMVGREGLNLHKACSTVILLHPEWNPGVVEQQIGRVDRVGSHWSSQLEKAIADNVPAENLPRINIRPVIFRGTYDEHHWKVLRERWDDLRAQLHGVVIPPRLCIGDPELQRLAQELEAAAPNFSPDRQTTSHA